MICGKSSKFKFLKVFLAFLPKFGTSKLVYYNLPKLFAAIIVIAPNNSISIRSDNYGQMKEIYNVLLKFKHFITCKGSVWRGLFLQKNIE